jgi:hypothetical protein
MSAATQPRRGGEETKPLSLEKEEKRGRNDAIRCATGRSSFLLWRRGGQRRGRAGRTKEEP